MRRLRVLVTGGLGYAGGLISSRLARQGHETFVLSRGKARPDLGAPYTLLSADISAAGADELAALLPPGLDGVVHAASLNEAFLPDYPRRALLVNALGTRTLLKALQKATPPGAALPLVVYCSTFHVYGQSTGRIDENSPPLPVDDYALTHFFGEEYCRAAMRSGGPPVVVVRLTNGYGLAAVPSAQKWHLLINDLCRAAVEQGCLTLRSDPSGRRDFIWLGDAARAVEALLGRRDLAGRLFNVSSDQSRSLLETARLVALAAEDALGRPVPVHCEAQAANPAPELFVSNRALCQALDFSFQDRLREEAAAIVRSLL